MLDRGIIKKEKFQKSCIGEKLAVLHLNAN